MGEGDGEKSPASTRVGTLDLSAEDRLQQRTEVCPTARGLMLGHTAITLLPHNTGALTKIHPPRHLSA